MNRELDLTYYLLEQIDRLELEFRNSLNPDLSATLRSIEIKGQIDALRMSVCEEVRMSIQKQLNKNSLNNQKIA